MSVTPAKDAGRGYGSPSVSYCPFKTLVFLTRASEEGWCNNANMLPNQAKMFALAMLQASPFDEAN